MSPELLPAADGEISQRTEDLVGPYSLHDFFLYYAVRWAFPPSKIYRLACYAFEGSYTPDEIKKWLINFYRRFFAQQFKRSCLPDGPKVGLGHPVAPGRLADAKRRLRRHLVGPGPVPVTSILKFPEYGSQQKSNSTGRCGFLPYRLLLFFSAPFHIFSLSCQGSFN